MATKQSPPARFLRLGDVVLDCGAAGHGHGTRGGRWSWLRQAALSGAFGDEREGEQRRRRGSRERGRSERGSGRRVASPERPGGGGGRQARRRWPGRVAARAGRVLILLAEEEGDREGGGGGLGRLLQQAAQVSGPQVSVR